MKLYDGNGKPIVIESTQQTEYKNPNLIDTSSYKTTGHADDPMHEVFGAAFVNYFDHFIDTTEHKTVFVRAVAGNIGTSGKVACYDADHNHIYTLNYTDGKDYNPPIVRSVSGYVGKNFSGNVYVMQYNFPDEVCYVKFAFANKTYQQNTWQYTIFSYEDITAIFALEDEYPVNPPKSVIFIGDSLTAWSDWHTIVRDKAGVATATAAFPGATWQITTEDGSLPSGAQYVDAIVSEKRKYDMYCFFLGANQPSSTDTGETSSDPTTMSGAIRYCMETIKTYDPTACVLVCLPPQSDYHIDRQETVNSVIESIVRPYSVHILDLYHEGGLVVESLLGDVGYYSDNIHFAENGREVVGNTIAAKVKSLMCL